MRPPASADSNGGSAGDADRSSDLSHGEREVTDRQAEDRPAPTLTDLQP
jgi:hypothetical protein